MAMSSVKKTNGSTDDEKIKLGFWVVIIGMVLAAVLFLAAMYKYTSASDVATSIGPVTTLIGTLSGAFFGQQIGSAGKDKAQKTAIKLAAAAASPTKFSADEIKSMVD
jgi:hypothetical protein